jgi:DNA-directed RNA polymerase
MTTPVQEQINNELQLIGDRVQKFHKDTYGKDGQSISITNTKLGKSLGIPQLVSQITSKILEVKEVKQGRYNRKVNQLQLLTGGHTKKSLGKEIVEFLTTGKNLQSKVNTFVMITLTEMFNGSFSIKRDDSIHPELSDDSLVVEISSKIGTQVEMFSRLNILKEQDKDIFNKVFYQNMTNQVFGLNYSIKKVKESLKDIDTNFVEWSREQRVRIGRILIGMVLNHYGDNPQDLPFFVSPERVGDETYVYLIPVQSLQDKVHQDYEEITRYLIQKEPMTVKPFPWSKGIHGGYLTNMMIKRENIVKGHQLEKSEPSQLVYDFINNLQGVGYKVNPFTLEVMNTLEGMGVEIGKFIPESALLKREIKDKETGEVIRTWKKSFLTGQLSYRTTQVILTANKWSDSPEFYIPWSFDFRGRVYPSVSYLNPQGTDLDKSLLMFSKGEPITEDGVKWLKIHISTTYGKDGLDKKSLTDRVKWVDDNIDLITQISEDPIGTLDLWKDAGEPWSFLSSCKEYVDVVINGHDTHLMVATDATCSGLQILSGLSLDRNSGKLVNVVPSPTLQDAYTAVADSAKEFLLGEGREDLVEVMNQVGPRSIAKKVVMTVPYNASIRTNIGQVKEVLKEKKVELDWEDIGLIGTSIGQHGMKSVVPGPMEVREWLSNSVTSYFSTKDEEGNTPKNITWVTPSGFKVVQENFKPEVLVIEGTLQGKRNQMKVTIGHTDEVLTRGHRTSFSPNLIHSLDGSLLHLTFQKVGYDFSVIHDSVLTNANHMTEAVTGLKETYSKMFDGRKYLNYIKETLNSEIPLPEFENTFDSSEVMDSEFFFS